MTQQELQEFLRPFEPIEVHLDNGDKFEIRHPDQIVVGPTTVIVLSQANRYVKFSMRKIMKIESLSAAETQS